MLAAAPRHHTDEGKEDRNFFWGGRGRGRERDTHTRTFASCILLYPHCQPQLPKPILEKQNKTAVPCRAVHVVEARKLGTHSTASQLHVYTVHVHYAEFYLQTYM